MAVDTREKRQSAYSLLVPALTPGIDPSSIDQAERQASVWIYSGILAGAAVAVTSGTRRQRQIKALIASKKRRPC